MPLQPRARRFSNKFPLTLVCLSLAGCGGLSEITRLLDKRTPRERYEAMLQSAGLANTAMWRDWASAADRALREAGRIATPHAEEGYLSPAEPTALAYRVSARRGQEIAFDVRLLGDTSALIFLEAFQLVDDSVPTYRRIASADSGVLLLSFEPRRDGDLVLRAQPELLRGGRFVVTIRVSPTLAFPVQGARTRDIGSRFGASRDAGRRSHHGIDIFARRGTPALAAAEATVSRVQTTPVGGKVVWLRDDRGNSLYYAHLDEQYVVPGARVRVGDTVGVVGNTGNARTTPPHLHFGVYRRGEGPVDPYWFVHQPPRELPQHTADDALIGEWARLPRDGINLRRAPDTGSDALVTFPQHTMVRVLSVTGSWYRVRLPDGLTGYVTARLTEPARRAVRTESLAGLAPLLARPLESPPPDQVIGEVMPGTSVAVLGRFRDYLFVREPGGTAGWISAGDAEGRER